MIDTDEDKARIISYLEKLIEGIERNDYALLHMVTNSNMGLMSLGLHDVRTGQQHHIEIESIIRQLKHDIPEMQKSAADFIKELEKLMVLIG